MWVKQTVRRACVRLLAASHLQYAPQDEAHILLADLILGVPHAEQLGADVARGEAHHGLPIRDAAPRTFPE